MDFLARRPVQAQGSDELASASQSLQVVPSRLLPHCTEAMPGLPLGKEAEVTAQGSPYCQPPAGHSQEHSCRQRGGPTPGPVEPFLSTQRRGFQESQPTPVPEGGRPQADARGGLCSGL